VVQHLKLNEENQYSTIDYSGDGRRFVVAGLKPGIEIWDEERCQMLYVLSKDMTMRHTNKIFTVKYFPQSSNMVYSGGWDCNVKFWDIRAGKLTHNLFGTQTCGDTIDMASDSHTFVTAGGSGGEGIQTWDLRKLDNGPLKKIGWTTTKTGYVSNPLFNSCKFMLGNKFIVAGGTDNEVPAKCFNAHTGDLIESFPHLSRSCFSLDVSQDSSQVVFGDADGKCHFENVNFTY